MKLLPPGSERTDTLFPYTTLCRSHRGEGVRERVAGRYLAAVRRAVGPRRPPCVGAHSGATAFPANPVAPKCAPTGGGACGVSRWRVWPALPAATARAFPDRKSVG